MRGGFLILFLGACLGGGAGSLVTFLETLPWILDRDECETGGIFVYLLEAALRQQYPDRRPGGIGQQRGIRGRGS